MIVSHDAQPSDTANPAAVPPLVRMTGIGKRFGSVWVLREAAMDIHAGEVHVLAGENGAGKSTFIKILAGVYRDYEGSLEFDGLPARPVSPHQAAALGVAVIHQELSLVPSMSVADNIFLGQAPARFGFVDDHAQHSRTRELLARLGIDADPGQLMEDLPVGVRQMVEIAKAVSRNARVLVMDEPTSALSKPEVEKLFSLIATLKTRGCGIVYITHKMEEIGRIADRITVLRDGRLAGSAPATDMPLPHLIRLMVGRDMEAQFPRHAPHPGPVRLRLDNVSVFPAGRRARPAVSGVTLEVRAGEILGIGGLQGSGASELLTGLFGGYGDRVDGDISLDGKSFRPLAPRHSIDQGLALLTNDRKATGLILSLSIIANATLADLPELSPGGWRRPRLERRATRSLADTMNLRAASLDMQAGELSGGNQQKVAFAKWLQTKPKLLLLDEPTRGIDVGAKRDIYHLMDRLTADGIAILLITSEMPELLAMSDRLVVMHRGRITAKLTRAEATPEAILAAAMGRENEKAAG
jgi:ABC-type sugar transport system ATPase subunit